MSAKNETHDQTIVIEDLSAQNTEAMQVKGGRYIKVVMEDCLISSFQTSGAGGGE